jgi:putative endonuclease
MWFVYIIECSDGSLYTGSTTDLKRRWKEHLAGRGGRYTRTHRPVHIVFQEPARSRSLAQRREAELKRYSRKKKLALVRGGFRERDPG